MNVNKSARSYINNLTRLKWLKAGIFVKSDCIFTPKSTALLNCSCDYKKKTDSRQLCPFDYLTPCAKTKYGKS